MRLRNFQNLLGTAGRLVAQKAVGKTFRFTVKTTVPNETFALPLEASGDYDFHIVHGDGNSSDITAWNHADVNHSYATPGTHEIRITGTIIGWSFANGGNKTLIYEIKSWGPLRLGDSGGYFYGCSNMTITATDVLDLTGMGNAGSFFNTCRSITTIPSINSWAWATINNMNGTFQNMNLFDQDLSGMGAQLSSVATMRFTLATTPSFDQDLSPWDVSSLEDATNFLNGVTLSVANYDALILSWSAQVPSGAYAFHGGNSKYTAGGVVATARAVWVTKGWTITDGGENLGSEMIAASDNRDFTVWGNVNWSGASGGSLADGTGKMEITMDSSGNCGAALSHTRIAGEVAGVLYKIQVDIWQGTTVKTPVRILLVGDDGTYEDVVIGAGQATFAVYLVMPVNMAAFQIVCTDSDNGTFFVDDVSIKECL